MTRFSQFQTKSKVTAINAANYLKRLKVDSEDPSINFLRKLHKAHLLRIPFENLDIHLNQPLIFDIQKIYKKIISEERGGFDCELNLLFFHLLHALGFVCAIGKAQIKLEKDWSETIDHPIILVWYDNEIWLADVGHYELFIEPKKIIADLVQLDYTRYFKFVRDADSHYILRQSKDNIEFYSHYRFDLVAHEMIEFLELYHFHQESLNSPLRKEKIISQLFPEGRVTLKERSLISHLNGETNETEILQEDDFTTKLKEIFNIDYNQLILQRINK